jgi:hypothetical protein
VTRHRKGLRPLSQTGLIRVPMNPRQRNFGEGGTKAKGTVLEAFNETMPTIGDVTGQLHPTKGWRTMSVKRGRAQMLMAEIRAGQGRPLHLQARFLAEGY